MTETTDPQADPLTDRQLDEIEKMPRAQDIDLLIAEVRRLRAAPAAVPSAPADRAALRDRIAVLLAEADGWKWADGFKEHSPAWQHYQQLADVVLAVLPAPADRAAVRAAALREAEGALRAQAKHMAGEFNDSDVLHEDGPAATVATWKRAADLLRRMAGEAQQDAPWLSDSARIGRTLIWTWADIGKGVYGQGYRAAQTEARTLLTGQRDSDEAQQPETQAGCGCPNENAVEHQFGTADCTCIPFVREGGTARYCQPGDTVDQISGWERGGDCPHHRPNAVGAQQPKEAGL
jgi:hypothetical protein